jgi:hypothetical protein
MLWEKAARRLVATLFQRGLEEDVAQDVVQDDNRKRMRVLFRSMVDQLTSDYRAREIAAGRDPLAVADEIHAGLKAYAAHLLVEAMTDDEEA